MCIRVDYIVVAVLIVAYSVDMLSDMVCWHSDQRVDRQKMTLGLAVARICWATRM